MSGAPFAAPWRNATEVAPDVEASGGIRLRSAALKESRMPSTSARTRSSESG
jgi:hypothetical protein